MVCILSAEQARSDLRVTELFLNSQTNLSMIARDLDGVFMGIPIKICIASYIHVAFRWSDSISSISRPITKTHHRSKHLPVCKDHVVNSEI